MHPLDAHPLQHLFTAPTGRSRRASSWDRSGGNRDYLVVPPGATVTLLEHDGPGCVQHLYFGLVFPEITDYRDAILRCFWDGESMPSVEVPLGDFFTLAHARTRSLRSHFVTVNPGFGASYGLNAYFPMPFARGARITLEHRGDRLLGGLLPALWYHIDYEVYGAPPPPETLRFHAQWRQERPTVAVGAQANVQLHEAGNVSGRDNYVALDAEGTGQMVGLVLEIENQAGGWYGEGDDMVFLDGDTWPPSIHGTGTEEIFGAGACPVSEYAGPFHGFHLLESADYAGLIGAYRWYVNDPIRFARSIRWTVEHGHANNFANDYSSVAYWYQSEPHAAFPALPARDAMRPPLAPPYAEARQALGDAFRTALVEKSIQGALESLAGAGESFYAGRFADALRKLA